MSTARSPAPLISCTPTSSAPSCCWMPRSATGQALTSTARDAFRFLHVSTDEVYGSLGADGIFTENTAYDPSRPIRHRKPPRIISARLLGTGRMDCRCDLQLFEQLRALSFPGKAHPADHPQRAGGPSPSGLRDWLECPRLALCRGSCPRTPSDPQPRPSRRELQYRLPQRADQPRARQRDLRDPRPMRAGQDPRVRA